MKAKIKFSNPGMLTTIQDYGRNHLQDIGISKGGAALPSLMEIGNELVGNKMQCSFEFIFNGPVVEIIEGEISVAVTGHVNFEILKNHKLEKGICFRSYILKKDDQIIVKNTIDSVYGYITFGGSIKLSKVFDSFSCNPRSKIGPRDGAKIKKDELFDFNVNENQSEYKLTREPDKQFNNKIRLLEGPQFHFFEKKSVQNFFNNPYEITTTTDKMGMRLSGSKIENQLTSNIKSEAIIKGAIQVPADGQPIILLTDHQTIGGYPKIAVVISADFEKLIQIPPKSMITFKKVNYKEAQVSYELNQKTLKNIINSKTKI